MIRFENDEKEGRNLTADVQETEDDIIEKKKQISEELYNKVLEEDTVKPDKYAQLNRDYIMKEVNHFNKKHQEFVQLTKSSFMLKKVPYRDLPDIEDGNYSMCLYNREAFEVNEWVKQDLRTESSAMAELKEDIKLFEEFDTFNVSDINQIKYRSLVNYLIEHKYVPIGVHMGTEVQNEVRYPDVESLAFDFRKYWNTQQELKSEGKNHTQDEEETDAARTESRP